MARVAVINLDRRPDRWTAFCERAPCPWPLPPIERVSAFDGHAIDVPAYWQSGPGAYGCLLSHTRLWEETAEQNQTLLVFEDDAVFCEHFADKFHAFIRAVPDDWQMLYFGGEHILPPEQIGGDVLRCIGAKKMHAYAVRGEPMRRLPPLLRRKTIHVDVELALLHHEFHVYAPAKWLCGQAASVSDILSGSKGEPERWWQPNDGRAAA